MEKEINANQNVLKNRGAEGLRRFKPKSRLDWWRQPRNCRVYHWISGNEAKCQIKSLELSECRLVCVRSCRLRHFLDLLRNSSFRQGWDLFHSLLSFSCGCSTQYLPPRSILMGCFSFLTGVPHEFFMHRHAGTCLSTWSQPARWVSFAHSAATVTLAVCGGRSGRGDLSWLALLAQLTASCHYVLHNNMRS